MPAPVGYPGGAGPRPHPARAINVTQWAAMPIAAVSGGIHRTHRNVPPTTRYVSTYE